jgi:lysylphosphatidylglycerol synthetase-like protein (DUF2156 family)
MRDRHPQIPRDGVYRAILWVLVGSVMFGALLAIAGETLYQNADLSRFGGLVVLVAGGVYAVFRWLGWQEAKRQAEAQGRDARRDSGPE